MGTDKAEEQRPYVFDRMVSAVGKVRERLERTCAALEQAKIPYAAPDPDQSHWIDGKKIIDLIDDPDG